MYYEIFITLNRLCDLFGISVHVSISMYDNMPKIAPPLFFAVTKFIIA